MCPSSHSTIVHVLFPTDFQQKNIQFKKSFARCSKNTKDVDAFKWDCGYLTIKTKINHGGLFQSNFNLEVRNTAFNKFSNLCKWFKIWWTILKPHGCLSNSERTANGYLCCLCLNKYLATKLEMKFIMWWLSIQFNTVYLWS